MREQPDPEDALERMADELEERKDRLDEKLDEARALLADRAREARHIGEREARRRARGEDFTGASLGADDEPGEAEPPADGPNDRAG